MNREQLRADLISEEGRVEHAYEDHLGFLTIGVGHLIDKRKGGRLPDHIIDALLDHDIDEVVRQMDAAAPWWQSQPSGVRTALAQMAFQLGVAGVLEFKNMVAAIQVRDYEAAATEALDSKWAKTDTPERAKRVAEMIRRWL